jgi:hypothetical protein
MSQKVYELKRMLWVPPITIIFFGLAAEHFLVKAMAGNNILVLFKSIRLSPEMSTFAYGVLFLISAIFVLLGFFLIFALLQGKRKIIVNAQSIVIPKFTWTGVKYVELPFSQISKLEEFKAGNGVFLNIHHTHGKSAVAKATFKFKDDFENIKNQLSTKING